MTQLKEHSKLTWVGNLVGWPPGPSGWATSGGRTVRDKEEIAKAVLTGMTWRPGREADHRPHVQLQAQAQDGRELTHALFLDDSEFLRLLANELERCLGLTLGELGAIQLPD